MAGHNKRFEIERVDRIKFAVEDFDQACRFARDWGLTEVASAVGEATVFKVVDGTEVEVVRSQPGVAGREPIGAASGVCEITWGVKDAHSLEALAEDLGRDRQVYQGPDGVLHTVDDLGIGLAFQVTRRLAMRTEPTGFNAPGAPQRINRRGVRYQRALPQEISHVAIGVNDAGEASRFYTERLGFLVSDRYADRGVFMRCSPVGNHHHLFLLNGREPHTRFNHLAFKVRDIHEVIGGGQHLDSLGWKTFAGPGRHMVSSACFWYFLSPFGGSWEYAADEDMVNEDWESTDFAATSHIFSEWTFGLERSDGTLRGPISQSRKSNAG
jgi:catechol 2,3-dioxygenase-like lactoylglutathione lyase family enzyme